MAGIGQLVVELIASTAAFQSDLGKAAAVADQHARRINKSIQGVQQQIVGFGKGVAEAIGIPLGGAALIALFEDIKTKTAESERSVSALLTTLQATGGAAGLTAANLRELGDAVKRSSVFSDEDIRKAETALLRFRNIQKGVFEDALKASADLAASSGRSLPEAAQLIGRFLNEPVASVRGLKNEGIELDQSQLDLARHLIETGHAAQGQRIALDELNRAGLGQAKAQTEGLAGASDLLRRSIEELQKSAGHQIFGAGTIQTLHLLTSQFESLRKEIDEGTLSIGVFFKRLGASAASTLVNTFAPGAARGLESAFQAPFESGGSRVSRGKITGAQSSADIDAANAAKVAKFKSDVNQATEDLKAELRQRAESASSYYAAELANQRAFLQQEQTALEFAYSRGEITVENFFARERGLAERTRQATLASLFKDAAAQQQLIESVGSTREERAAAEQRKNQIAVKLDEAEKAGTLREIQLTQQEILGVERLSDAYAELGEKLAEAQGNTAAAVGTRFERENRVFRNQLQSRGDDAGQARLGRLGEIVSAQARLNDLEGSFATVLGNVSIAQTHIDLAVQTGTLTEIDGLNARSAVAQKYIGILGQVADAAEREAASLSGPAQAKALLGVEQLRLQIAQLAVESDALAKKFRDVFEDSFADALTSLVTGTKSARDALKDMLKSIEQSLVQIASKNVAQQIFGKGGPLGGISDFFAKAFGGGAAVGADAGAAALTGAGATLDAAGIGLSAAGVALESAAASIAASSGLSGAGSGIGGLISGGGGGSSFFGGLFASGGSPPVGLASIVGERGPEIFVPRTAGTVIPNELLGRRGTRSGHTFNISINMPSGTSTATAAQVARETGLAVRRATRAAGIGA